MSHTHDKPFLLSFYLLIFLLVLKPCCHVVWMPSLKLLRFIPPFQFHSQHQQSGSFHLKPGHLRDLLIRTWKPFCFIASWKPFTLCLSYEIKFKFLVILFKALHSLTLPNPQGLGVWNFSFFLNIFLARLS